MSLVYKVFLCVYSVWYYDVMDKKETTEEHLLRLLEQKRSPTSLSEEVGVSRQNIHRYLDAFIKRGIVEKFGIPPSVYYIKRTPHILDTFAYLTPAGDLLEGDEAFVAWSRRNLKKLTLHEKEERYMKLMEALESKKDQGFFSLIGKLSALEEIGETIHLSSLKVIELSRLEDFGRTHLQYLLESAKSVKNTERREPGMRAVGKIIDRVFPKIERHAAQMEVDAVAFVPHTLKRGVQLMEEIKKEWKKKSTIPVIEVKKIFGSEAREQKSIKDVRERIENAEKTFQVTAGPSYENVMLVDDFIASGATLNQVAKEIQGVREAEQVFGLALVGEEKGYSVIRSV